MSRVLSSLLIVSFLAGGALAAPTHSWVLVQEGATLSTSGGTLPGTYSTWDLMVTTGTDFATAQMIAHADVPGTIYHHDFAGNTAPNSALIGAFPDMAFDTYVTTPPGTFPDAVSQVTPADLAAELGIPNPGILMTDQDMSIGWAVSSGDALFGPGTHRIARITTKDLEGPPEPGSEGHWDMILWESGEGGRSEIISGNLPIFTPEPATMMVLAFGALAGLLRRRR